MRQIGFVLLAGAITLGTSTQIGAAQAATRIVATPDNITVEVGASVPLSLQALDESGVVVDVAVQGNGPRGAFEYREGRVEGTAMGQYELIATAPGADGRTLTLRVPVTVSWPAITRVEIAPTMDRQLYVGTTLSLTASAFHAAGDRRPTARFTWTSSDPDVATVARDGSLTAYQPGSVSVTAEFEGANASQGFDVKVLNADRLEITGGLDQARTGDVLTFEARIIDGSGRSYTDVPVTWAYTFTPDDTIHAPGSAGIVRDGKFVGAVPGHYTVLAMAGNLSARRLVDIRPRGSIQRIDIVGQGAVRDAHTSDLWIFEGLGGRDYALTGTWSAAGKAYVWDVTDPGNMVKTDSIQLDARTVNDVKVSPDSRYAALSREGASNRRNGVVILDLADPAHPEIVANYDEGLTGGVHNMFATNDHLFALSGGDKYIILDMSDITNPTYVSEYNHPESRVHDVWVHDGIAYSSEWKKGVVVVDVGNGRWGGSIENPVFVTSVDYPVGATHAAFPYFQESTGKFYLFLGDEMSGLGRAYEGYGTGEIYDPETGEGGVWDTMGGYVHIIDFTDPMNPQDVARYEVPEAGSHNLWVENDILYQAYYEGGLRIVDVSGELMGDLFDQGREIAVFKAWDPVGIMANQPSAWGPQPYKGHLFFSDMNSGLWAVKLQPKRQPII